MKQIYLLLIVVIFSSSIKTMKAQWNQCSNVPLINGGEPPALDIVSSNGVLIAGTWGGILKSTDNGVNWSYVTLKGGSTNSILNVESVGNRIYAGESGNTNGDIYYSLDLGDSWILDTLNLPWNPPIPPIFPNPRRAHVLNMITWSNYVFVHLDGVKMYAIRDITDPTNQWRKVIMPTGNFYPKSFTVINDTLYGAGQDGIYYTADLGFNWIKVNANTSNWPIRQNPPALTLDPNLIKYHNNNIYISFTDNSTGFDKSRNIYYSTDMGINWDSLNYTNSTKPINSWFFENNDIYLTTTYDIMSNETTNRILKSSNNGMSFSDFSNGLIGWQNENYLNIIRHNNSLFVGSYSGSKIHYINLPTRINKNEVNKEISIFPNPSEGLFYINSSNKIDNLSIYNNLGVKVLEENYPSQTAEVDLSKYKDGIYFISVLIDNQLKTFKVVKN